MKKFALSSIGLLLLVGCGQTTATHNTSTTVKQTSAQTTTTQSTTQQTTTTTTTTVAKKATGIDSAALLKGDFSSVVGTWRNKDGHTLTFDKNGLITENLVLRDLTTQLGLVYGHVNIVNGPGFALTFVPKDTKIPDELFYEGTDTSDITKDRLFGAQAKIKSSDLDPYYRVED